MPTNTESKGNPAMFNWISFFKEEKDVWVQNISNKQISMQFAVNGGVEPFLLPAMKDPVNLTQHVPFAAIKESVDFRRMVARRPAVITILSEEDVQAYYANKAKLMGWSGPDVAMADAEARAFAIRNRQPLPDAPPPRKVTEDPDTGNEVRNVSVDELINPRVLHICAQVSAPGLKDNERATAQQTMSELAALSDLTLDDYMYIESNGYYSTIRKWAREEIKKLAAKTAEQD